MVTAGSARVRTVALVRRVSTDGQALNEEGSLVTQAQRMRQHLEYKREVVGEPWEETELYDLHVVSGKDSLRSPEFQRLLEDIRAGKVNTILCTELPRVCRNVREFLELLDVLSEYKVEFASIKEQFDTTTPHGRLVLTMLMALAQFEREQTAERTREAVLARSERGLWNGGQLLGFDLDPERKGYLIPNETELAAVEFAMDAFLEQGTIADAQVAFNRAGYRTKSYTSRRGVFHPEREISFTGMQHLLKNVAYLGKKQVGGQLVEAVWPVESPDVV